MKRAFLTAVQVIQFAHGTVDLCVGGESGGEFGADGWNAIEAGNISYRDFRMRFVGTAEGIKIKEPYKESVVG